MTKRLLLPSVSWLVITATVTVAIACNAMPPDPAPIAATTAPEPANPDRVRDVVVGPAKVECQGVAPQWCLIVDGEFFYDDIDGFDHEAGYRYRLRIEEYDRWPGQTEIPQDTGRYGYRLLAVLEKTPAVGG